MALFLGSFTHTMDQGNRLSIPSKLRDELGDKIVICIPQNGDRCLFAYTPEDWAELMERFNDRPSSRLQTMRQRKLNLETEIVLVNGKGRISLPPRFMEAVGIRDEVFILGAGRRIEFWDPAEWARMESQFEENEEELKSDFAF